MYLFMVVAKYLEFHLPEEKYVSNDPQSLADKGS